MKKVLILFSKSEWKKSKPPQDEAYRYSYEYFYSLCKKNGIQMYRASYEWYDYKKNIFKHAWIFNNKGNDWQRVHNIRPDLIYDKTKARLEIFHKKELIGENFPFINDLLFTQIIDNKFLNSLMFRQWSKAGWLIRNKNELIKILKKITTDKVVIKPLRQSGGEGIQIFQKKRASQQVILNQTYLAQDFIDSSHGIPRITKGLHDLRMIMVNDKLVYSLVREPSKGSFLANLAQGGIVRFIPSTNIPKSVSPIIRHANKLFSAFYPRIFSIDIMFDRKKRPWVVELNSMPGLYFPVGEKLYMVRMYNELSTVFKKFFKDTREII